jgi:hypothetical protein
LIEQFVDRHKGRPALLWDVLGGQVMRTHPAHMKHSCYIRSTIESGEVLCCARQFASSQQAMLLLLSNSSMPCWPACTG